MQHDHYIQPVRHWLETLVIEFNLCPFAKREFINNRIRFALSEASTEQKLLIDLQEEFTRLSEDSNIETTLLIHPHLLQDFFDYNEFLDIADGLLIDLQLDGIYQVASFHPDYQFADTNKDDVENFSNRSPYPLLHLIREHSLEQAISTYPNPELIPERNIKLLKGLGKQKMQALFQSHFDVIKD